MLGGGLVPPSGDRLVSAALQDAVVDAREDLRRACVVDVGNISGHGVGIDHGSCGIDLYLNIPAKDISRTAGAGPDLHGSRAVLDRQVSFDACPAHLSGAPTGRKILDLQITCDAG